MQEAAVNEQPILKRFPVNKLVVAVWCAVAISGHVLIAHYGSEDRLRALRLWEQRLTLVAHSQSEQIAALMKQKADAIRAIADNASVQLYLATVSDSGAEGSEAEMTFLRNYILAVASQSGLFQLDSQAESISANVNLEADAGLAIIRPDGSPVVSTRYFPAIATHKDALLTPAPDGVAMVGPDEQTGRLWLSVPIRGVQAEEADAPVGFVIGSFKPLEAVDAILARGELPDSPANSRLVATDGESIRLIAPTVLREQPLQSAQYQSIAAQTHQQHNQFIEGRDESGAPAFGYAKAVEMTGWSVVRQVSRHAALKDTVSRARQLLIAYWLAVGVVTMTVVALWRHMTVSRLGELLRNISQHERLLEAITKHIPATLFIVDASHRFQYANEKLAEKTNVPRGDIRDKSLQQVIGAAADAYVESSDRALRRGEPENVFREHSVEGKLISASETQYLPIKDLPQQFSGGTGEGVLVIEQDLTDILRSKYAQQQTLNKLIETIVALADMRDPNAKRHSRGVVMISRAIAETMQLEHLLIDTVTIAGQLMNLGKLFIPRDLLTSNAAILDKDKQQIAESMQQAIKHLSDVPFEGPVVDTLRQVQERVNGSGPLGLLEDDILLTAKIIAVANSFVALTSPRSYRDKHSVSDAMTLLQRDSGTLYAANVLTALSHYLANLGGAVKWEQFNV